MSQIIIFHTHYFTTIWLLTFTKRLHLLQFRLLREKYWHGRQVWERSDHQLHTPGRRVRPHDLLIRHARQTLDLGRGRGGTPQGEQDRVHDQDTITVQDTIRRQQCGNIHTGAPGRWQSQLQVLSWQCDIPAGQGHGRLDHQAVPRGKGVPYAGALWTAQHQPGGRRPLRQTKTHRKNHGQLVEGSHRGQIRNTILYGIGDTSPLSQNYRKEWISSSALGEVHYGQRGLSVENGIAW